MPRKKLIRSEVLPYHITARTNNREVFVAPLEDVWEVFGRALNCSSIVTGLKVHALVLMPNHFHLLASTPDGDLGLSMRYLMADITRMLNRKTQRSGRVFGARYHWSLIADTTYFCSVYRYIYQNPLRAGLCRSVTDYPFSSIQTLLGCARPRFQLAPPLVPIPFEMSPAENHSLIRWLNQSADPRQVQGMRKALRRLEFTPPRIGGWKKGFDRET